ncbi:Homeobox protein Hox-A4 (fragment) [Streptantibioticus cattleyicolor NRRL 8057 = DSM 46488]
MTARKPPARESPAARVQLAAARAAATARAAHGIQPGQRHSRPDNQILPPGHTTPAPTDGHGG